jgi:hypothetical protein
MPQLWLIPADKKSYQQTLAQPRDLTPAPDKPQAFPDEARVWGVRTDPEHKQAPWPRNKRNLERMNPSDPLLIYLKGDGHYVASGSIGGPIWHTQWVRDEFWDGGPALDIFHIDDWTSINFEPETVNRILGYKKNTVPQGLWRVADDRPIGRLLQQIDFSE